MDIFKDALISINAKQIYDWRKQWWKYVTPAFLLENNKMYELLFKISISAIFEHLTNIDNKYKKNQRRNINLTFLSYDDVAIASIEFRLDDVYYYEGAINKKNGNVLSPFRKVKNGFSESKCAIDEKHKKIITNSAIYDINGKIICSDFDEVIAIDTESGRYILKKENVKTLLYEAFLFNAENQIINLDLGSYALEDGSINNVLFGHNYIIINIEYPNYDELDYDYYTELLLYDEEDRRIESIKREDEYERYMELLLEGKNEDEGRIPVVSDKDSILFNNAGKKLIKSSGKMGFSDKHIYVEKGRFYNIYTLDDCKYLYTLELLPGKVFTLEELYGRIIKASIPNKKSRKYGYVLFPEKIVVPFQYDYVSIEYKDYAIVGISGKRGLINALGIRTIEPIYDFLEHANANGDILLSNNGGELNKNKEVVGGLWGAVKTTGEILFEPYYDNIWIKDQYFFVFKEYKCGLININGNKILDVIYDNILSPSENMIAIKISRKQLKELGKTQYGDSEESLWGFADLNGDIKIEPTFEEVRRFSAGRAVYKQDGRYGFIDINGKKITPPLYSDAESFDVVKQKAIVYIGKYYNYVNLNGELLADWLPDHKNVHKHFNEAYNEEKHYNRYNGAYAQAIEGWSDEEIDEAFDGYPDAYWNID